MKRGGLSFSQIVAHWLAGELLVPEYTQHVVAQLEGVTEGEAD